MGFFDSEIGFFQNLSGGGSPGECPSNKNLREKWLFLSESKIFCRNQKVLTKEKLRCLRKLFSKKNLFNKRFLQQDWRLEKMPMVAGCNFIVFWTSRSDYRFFLVFQTFNDWIRTPYVYFRLSIAQSTFRSHLVSNKEKLKANFSLESLILHVSSPMKLQYIYIYIYMGFQVVKQWT